LKIRPHKDLVLCSLGVLSILASASFAAEETRSQTNSGSPKPVVVERSDPPLGVTGTVRKHDNFASAFVSARDVHVWLPLSYGRQSERRYPVLYAQDGQNQFDPKLSFIGVDWALDETMTRLIAEGRVLETIVVAVWNTSRRLEEYLPAKAILSAKGTEKQTLLSKELSRGGRAYRDEDWLADRYLKFMVQELKPFIDKEYRTQTGRSDTFIMGSSAGALLSLYAVSEYPEVFGGAACLSTHFPLADGMLVDYFRDHLPDPAAHKIYFDFGTETIDKNYEPYQLKMDAAMEKRGYRSGINWRTLKFEGDDHSERAWRKRVHIPLEFLLGETGAAAAKAP
jgi:predicted alpha/beta superfamily hydrolase